MYSTWQLNAVHDSYGVFRRTDLIPNETASGHLEANLDRWLSDPLSRQALMGMYHALHGQNGAPARAASKEEWKRYLMPRLKEAFRRGELLLLRKPPRGGNGAGVEEDSPPPVPRQPAAPALRPQRDKTWIEIELVDEQGNPVRNQRCRLEKPDGTMWEGTLDTNGIARVDFIDYGTCEVCFPDLDLNEWEAQGRR